MCVKNNTEILWALQHSWFTIHYSSHMARWWKSGQEQDMLWDEEMIDGLLQNGNSGMVKEGRVDRDRDEIRSFPQFILFDCLLWAAGNMVVVFCSPHHKAISNQEEMYMTTVNYACTTYLSKQADDYVYFKILKLKILCWENRTLLFSHLLPIPIFFKKMPTQIGVLLIRYHIRYFW